MDVFEYASSYILDNCANYMKKAESTGDLSYCKSVAIKENSPYFFIHDVNTDLIGECYTLDNNVRFNKNDFDKWLSTNTICSGENNPSDCYKLINEITYGISGYSLYNQDNLLLNNYNNLEDKVITLINDFNDLNKQINDDMEEFKRNYYEYRKFYYQNVDYENNTIEFNESPNQQANQYKKSYEVLKNSIDNKFEFLKIKYDDILKTYKNLEIDMEVYDNNINVLDNKLKIQKDKLDNYSGKQSGAQGYLDINNYNNYEILTENVLLVVIMIILLVVYLKK